MIIGHLGTAVFRRFYRYTGHIPELCIGKRDGIRMNSKTPVNISGTADVVVKFNQEILNINIRIIFRMTGRTVPVPALVKAHIDIGLCIHTLDRRVAYTECLCILSDKGIPVRPVHIVPFSFIHFVSDDEILCPGIGCIVLQILHQSFNSFIIGCIHHIIGMIPRMRVLHFITCFRMRYNRSCPDQNLCGTIHMSHRNITGSASVDDNVGRFNTLRGLCGTKHTPGGCRHHFRITDVLWIADHHLPAAL